MLCRLTCYVCWFFFQAEDGIRDLVRSRGLGDVYKRQEWRLERRDFVQGGAGVFAYRRHIYANEQLSHSYVCLLYTSDAADERSRVDLGGRRIIKKRKKRKKKRKAGRIITTHK